MHTEREARKGPNSFTELVNLLILAMTIIKFRNICAGVQRLQNIVPHYNH